MLEDGKMTKKAIIYSSKLGKTRKISEYIAKELNADLFDLKKQTVIDMSKYDHIIFGTGIHAGKPYKPLVEFLAKNEEQLLKKKTTLFLSCMYDDMKGTKQLEKVSGELKIRDAFFFHGKTEKSEEGIEKSVDEFINEMLKR